MFSNALNHSSPGSPIEFEWVMHNGQTHLTMWNQGGPIPPSITEGFDRKQADNRKHFGLYLMEQIVKGYRGFIDWEMLPAEHTRAASVGVTVRLPTAG